MELYTFFVFFSVIVTPEGDLRTMVKQVTECPTRKEVLELHLPKMDSGEIVDWAATCLQPDLPLEVPPKGIST